MGPHLTLGQKSVLPNLPHSLLTNHPHLTLEYEEHQRTARPASADVRGRHLQHLLQVHSDFPNADLRKVYANKIKWVQVCIDARGHHFQHLLQVCGDLPNADLQKVFANKIKRVQVCIDARGHNFQQLL
jgi:hypothetical protein